MMCHSHKQMPGANSFISNALGKTIALEVTYFVALTSLCSRVLVFLFCYANDTKMDGSIVFAQ